jgi:hypothetical protein
MSLHAYVRVAWEDGNAARVLRKLVVLIAIS